MEYIGKYKVIRELGTGGFGAVYLAEDPRLGQVAIKLFKVRDSSTGNPTSGYSVDTESVLKERFLNEASILRAHKQLRRNPYIIDVFDFDEAADGTPYYVMPYLPRSLRNLLGSDAMDPNFISELPAADKPKPLPFRQALLYLEQLLIALKDVHQQGIVHRDIKPANVLLNEDNEVQLADFGVSKLPDTGMSVSGVAFGTGNYMSPEQRQSAKHVDSRSDVYSAGVLAYRMLTGTMPEGRFKDPIIYEPELPEAVNEIIIRALEQNKDRRFRDAVEMLSAFQQAWKVSPVSVNTIEHSGTWVGDMGVKLATNLQPVKKQLVEILQRDGFAREEQLDGIRAMAMVAGLSEDELATLISQTEQEMFETLKPYRNWLSLLDIQAQKDNGKLNPASRRLLLQAGSLLHREEKELVQKIEHHYQSFFNEHFNKPEAGILSNDPQASNAGNQGVRLITSSDKFADKVYEIGDKECVMKAIPEGTFSMGGEAASAHPQHKVTIKSFYLMETPFTFGHFHALAEMGMKRASGIKIRNHSHSDYPAVKLSWHYLTEHLIPFLNSQSDSAFRLPTEAEWEYACRAGTTTYYSFGNHIKHNQARFDAPLFSFKAISKTGPASIKSYPANAWGLFDMHGNVWEWMQDSWNDSYKGAPVDGRAWTSGDDKRAVIRGGAWHNFARYLKSGCRLASRKNMGDKDIGFRLAMDL